MILDVGITNSRSFFRVETWSTNSGLAPDLRLSAQPLTNGILRLSWNSSVGRGYQLQTTTNFGNWTPISAWTQAVSATTSLTVPASASSALKLFRVEVRP